MISRPLLPTWSSEAHLLWLTSRLRNCNHVSLWDTFTEDITLTTQDHRTDVTACWNSWKLQKKKKKRRTVCRQQRNRIGTIISASFVNLLWQNSNVHKENTRGGKWAQGSLCVGLKLLQEKVNTKVLLQAWGSSSTEQEKDNYALWSSWVALTDSYFDLFTNKHFHAVNAPQTNPRISANIGYILDGSGRCGERCGISSFQTHLHSP